MTNEDIILAQSILDAANITLPTGNPNDGIYDGKLNQIKIKEVRVAGMGNVVQNSMV